MTKPRIALFTGNYVHIKDGVSLTLNRLVRHLERRGVESVVFGPGCPEYALEPAGRFVEVPSVPSPGRPEYRISLFFPEVLRHELELFKPDIIHIATPDILGFRALRLAVKQNIPVISSYHTHFPSYLKYYSLDFLEPLLWKYLLWFYNSCDRVVSPSESMNEFLERTGIPKEKLGIWTRGIDTSLFSPENRSNEFRRELGFKDDDIVVTFISRLVWEKNLDTFIEATDKARERNSRIKVLVGGDGPVMEEVRSRMPHAVFTGHRSGAELAKVYAAADIFFFPSETETFGNVTLEAMASGLPALVADAPGSKSLVIEGQTGYILPPNDAAGFAEKIVRLTEDDALRKNMSAEARNRANTFDWEKIMDDLVADYHQLAKAARYR